MVFDDSFEHEVVHDGQADRYVLYAVLHHPDLGEPRLPGTEDEASQAGSAAEACNAPQPADEESGMDSMD